MKRKTKADKFSEIADAVHAINAGEPMPKKKAKDGSIPTHPVVPVPVVAEKYVVRDCIRWLKRHDIYCVRHDVGGGRFGQSGQYAVFGIRGAGDIVGLLRNGRHLEIECKHGRGGRLSKDQQKHRQHILDNSGLYFVVHGVEELEHFMKEYV